MSFDWSIILPIILPVIIPLAFSLAIALYRVLEARLPESVRLLIHQEAASVVLAVNQQFGGLSNEQKKAEALALLRAILAGLHLGASDALLNVAIEAAVAGAKQGLVVSTPPMLQPAAHVDLVQNAVQPTVQTPALSLNIPFANAGVTQSTAVQTNAVQFDLSSYPVVPSSVPAASQSVADNEDTTPRPVVAKAVS